MLENAKRWVNPINTSNKAKKIRRSMMAGLATFAVAVLLFAQIVLSADEAKCQRRNHSMPDQLH